MKSTSNKTLRILTASWLTSICFVISGVAFAQTDDQSDQSGESAGMMEEVVVVAEGYRESLRSAIQTKQGASQIVDAITAEDMGPFPGG